MDASNEEKYYTIREAASRLNVNPRTINRWIHKGELQAIKLPGRAGGEFRIPANEVEKLLGRPFSNDITDLQAEYNRLRAILQTILERQERAIYVAGRGYEVYLDSELYEQIREAVGQTD
jgi:excisionase family DNA binding protein